MQPEELVPQLSSKSALLRKRERELATERNKYAVSEGFETNLYTDGNKR